mgnify:CR=1 FL=1
MSKSATLYRMHTKEHICPYGLRSKDLLERKGFKIDDHKLSSREETDKFKGKHGVETTPQTFINDNRIGGYDELREFFDMGEAGQTGTTYTPVIAIFATAFLMALGIVFAIALSYLDYHYWRRFAVLAMLATIVALIAVLFIQELRLGAVRTFYNGSIQPSELAKLVIIIYLAVWLYAKRAQLHSIELGLIPLAIILGGVGGLIYLQPDISATATIFILGGVLFFLAGADLKQIIILMLLIIP